MSRPSPLPLTVALLGSVVLTTEVVAGTVSGNLTGLADPSAATVQIEVTCPVGPGKPEPPDKPASADEPVKPDQAATPAPPKSYKVSAKIPGPYSVNVQQQGDCTLTVTYQKMTASIPQTMTASIPIVSEKGSVRYDLVLSIVDGKLKLRRQ